MIKVASYCRVSTDKEDQANSFSSQQRFFREYIERHPDWELFAVYADEGITGTSTKKRVQFNRMLSDAYHRQFQLILTKEVSRFSRNILDTITYTRELKALGIGVIFMSDGFSSLDPDAELRLSIMGSIAQEESRKTSSRVKWGQTRQMERGVVFGRSLLGYDLEKGKLTVNAEGAEIVKRIFHMYGVERKGTRGIARELREAGCKTHSGNALWSDSHILKILKNEKYVGDLIQKKTITPDYLTHEKKYNRGEEEFIMIQNHHEPIISRELWDLVQAEIGKRHRSKNSSEAHSSRYLFSGKIICGQCGSRFISRQKVRKDGSAYRRWGCYRASRYGTAKTDARGNALGCDIGKQIRDDLAADMLKEVIRNLRIDRDWLLRNVSGIVYQAIRDGINAASSPQKLQKQIDSMKEKKRRALDCYLSQEISKEEFYQIKQSFDAQLDALECRLKQVIVRNEPWDEQAIHRKIESILACTEESETFLKCLLDYMVVHKDGTVEIKLKGLATLWKYQLYKGTDRP